VANGRLEEVKAASWRDLPELIGDLGISPQFMRSDHKGILVKQSAIDLLDMLLTLTTEIDGTTSKVLPNLVRYCASANPRGLRAMMPAMHERLAACPKHWRLYIAGAALLDALDVTLRDPGLPT
jgi:hypothetical protein